VGGRTAGCRCGRCHDRAGRVTRRRVLERRVPSDGGMWDVQRRRIVSASQLSPYSIAADVTFSPDGATLATAVNDADGATAIEILSVPQLAQLKTLRGPAASSLEFSPDGGLLALGDDHGRVWLYDTRTWNPRGRLLNAHTSAVNTVNFS